MRTGSLNYTKAEITGSAQLKKETVDLFVKKTLPKHVKFTAEEDANLKHGIIKHGRKGWASILKDKQYKFHHSRTRDSLRMRAKSKGF